MTTNDTLLPTLQKEPGVQETPEELLAFLAERIARYTMGDSASVPVDTARRLLESIVYCLELCHRFPSQETPSDAPLKTRWEAGVRRAKRIASRAQLLLHQAQRMEPPIVNTGYCDTLASLPGFFRAYDADFFAHEIPCSFDYPLCRPVPETLLGAEYIQEYLRRLLAENTFLRAFSAEALRALYERYYIDYADLLVNLCLPAIEMATLCTLAEQPVIGLAISSEQFSGIGSKLSAAGEEGAHAMLLEAALQTLKVLNLRGEDIGNLVTAVADDLYVRLRSSVNLMN